MFLKGTKIKDLRGNTYNKLTVLDLDWEWYTLQNQNVKNGIPRKAYKWICQCECGKTTSVCKNSLRKGLTTSCGKCYTLEDWCIDNDRNDILQCWDYELNDINPCELSFSSEKISYLKCHNNNHPPIKTSAKTITHTKARIICKQCNSIGQHMKDKYGSISMWGNNKNTNPFLISVSNGRYYRFKCPDCGMEKCMAVSQFSKNGISCSCKGMISYPNKFIHGLLSQLKCGYKNEKFFNWSNRKIYDFYIHKIACIIEANGEQHYISSGFSKLGGRTLKEEQDNDKLKREMALNNGIKHYIELDCRKSELEWIKNSIMNSELPKLLNFKEEDIDWAECEMFATKNLAKEVCDLWNSGIHRPKEISEMLKLNSSTVIRYLKTGKKFGWCNYNNNLVADYCNNIKKRKHVIVIKDGEEVLYCDSAHKAMLECYATLGVITFESRIRSVCRGDCESHMGLMFKYTSEQHL